MRYALLICTDESAAVGAGERARRAAALDAFTERMSTCGTMLAGEQLHGTETAAAVRCWDGGDVMITEGPFAQTREQVTGLFIVECQDLTEAIQFATTVPAAWYATVEVRPVRQA
ncbi:MAG TPA: YciI family protein [Streptosporangiaceae bacterium]|nr:YciI family protein [Streptosporangiaceae bacterium]